jgi:hypothetical protein
MTITDFDYPYTIQLVKIAEGYTNQSTGEYIPGSETVTEIKGHIQDITAKLLQQLPEGEYSIGDRRLYTDADIKPGDIVRITEPDNSVTEWIVKEQERNYNFLSKHQITRRVFLLKRKG